MISQHSGLTKELVMEHLGNAWNTFLRLPFEVTADEQDDFRRAIHEAERIIALAAIRIQYPEYWN